GRHHGAAIICRKLLHEYPAHRNALHLLGIVEQQSGNFQVAHHLFQQLLAVDPGNHAAWSNYGVACLSLGNREHARHCFENALRICPEYADAWNNLGTCIETVDPAQAEECYRKALEHEPASVDACNNLALLCKKSKRIAEAVRYYRQSLSIRAGQAGTWYRLGEVLEDAAQGDEAREAY